jgi:hypothetical protein
LQVTNHYCTADQQMDVVRSDRTSIVDGIDTKLLEIYRRGWPAHKQTERRGALTC